jgi:hypothetical protein
MHITGIVTIHALWLLIMSILAEISVVVVQRACNTFWHWISISQMLRNCHCGITYTHSMFALTLRGPSLLWTEWRARCGYTHTHWMSTLTLRGPSLLWTGWRARCGYTHTHWMSALTLRGLSLLWTGWRTRCGYTHTHWMSALTSRGSVVALDRMKS